VSYLVDTNVFSELAKTKPDAQVIAWLRDHEPELYLIVTRNISDFQNTGVKLFNPFAP